MVFYHFNTFSTQPSTDNKQKTTEAGQLVISMNFAHQFKINETIL